MAVDKKIAVTEPAPKRTTPKPQLSAQRDSDAGRRGMREHGFDQCEKFWVRLRAIDSAGTPGGALEASWEQAGERVQVLLPKSMIDAAKRHLKTLPPEKQTKVAFNKQLKPVLDTRGAREHRVSLGSGVILMMLSTRRTDAGG